MTEQMENELVDLEALQCKKCGAIRDKFSFYKYKNSNERFLICKDCLMSQLDIYNKDTFLWILKELDIPFIEEEWNRIVERHNDKSVLGRYIAKMKLRGFQGYSWLDSEKINEWHCKQKIESEIDRVTEFIPRPLSNEIVVLRVDLNEYNQEECNEIHRCATEMFPNNKVVTLPIDCQIQYFEKEEFFKMVEDLEKFIETGQ